MTLSPLLRAVGLARRSRARGRTSDPSLHVDTARRHPAMAGLNISPVHGRHCICQRCEREAAHSR